jgi:hypothetical protein
MRRSLGLAERAGNQTRRIGAGLSFGSCLSWRLQVASRARTAKSMRPSSASLEREGRHEQQPRLFAGVMQLARHNRSKNCRDGHATLATASPISCQWRLCGGELSNRDFGFGWRKGKFATCGCSRSLQHRQPVQAVPRSHEADSGQHAAARAAAPGRLTASVVDTAVALTRGADVRLTLLTATRRERPSGAATGLLGQSGIGRTGEGGSILRRRAQL